MQRALPYSITILSGLAIFIYTVVIPSKERASHAMDRPLKHAYTETSANHYTVENISAKEYAEKNLITELENTFTHWYLTKAERKEISDINKLAMQAYKAAKTDEERKRIIKRYPYYFSKIGRPLLEQP